MWFVVGVALLHKHSGLPDLIIKAAILSPGIAILGALFGMAYVLRAARNTRSVTIGLGAVSTNVACYLYFMNIFP